MSQHPQSATKPAPSRADLTAKMRSILDRAEGEGRDLTDAEAKSFDALKAKRDAAPLVLSSKAELVDILHAAGLPKSAAKAVAAQGWAGLASEQDHERLAPDLTARIAQFTQSIRRKS